MLKDKETGNILVTEEKIKLLMNRMRFPSLSLHGIFGGAEPGMTIIPSKVSGEFSIRFVYCIGSNFGFCSHLQP
jgi:Cys-Gly metallodipeptidase DUG1